MFISARHATAGMDVSGDKKKDHFASPGLLLQMSSHLVVYSFHLLCIVQKHLQINPEFRGQAMKSCASSDPALSRAENQQRSPAASQACSGQSSAAACKSAARGAGLLQISPSAGTGIRGILTRSQPMGSPYKPAAWKGCAMPSSTCLVLVAAACGVVEQEEHARTCWETGSGACTPGTRCLAGGQSPQLKTAGGNQSRRWAGK